VLQAKIERQWKRSVKYDRGGARDWVRKTLRGYITIVYTPFLDSGDVDEQGLRHNVERTIALPGVGGLSLCSIHQEFWTLTTDERKRLVECAIDQVAGRCPVVVGCSDPSARNVVDLAKHAEQAGADLIMVWPAYYGPRSPEGMRAFYESIASSIDIGMMVYSTTLDELGYYLTPEEVAGLLHIPNVCGVQNTTLNVAQYAAMMREVGEVIPVATSLEEYFFFGKVVYSSCTPDFMIGSSRPVFCQSTLTPNCGEFVRAMEIGDQAAAALHLARILRIAHQIQSRYFARGFHHLALFKALAGALGMKTGGARPPIGEPDEADLKACLNVLVLEGILAG
jgi:4-hydroxy-tetrahydrodipicolinate synthase